MCSEALQLPNTAAGDQITTAPTINRGRWGQDRKLPLLRWREATPCETPGCNEIVPAGYYPAQQKHAFHSKKCMYRYHSRKHVIGTCNNCGGPIHGTPSKASTRKFCSEACELENFDKNSLGRTGPFRQIIEDYLASSVPLLYKKGTHPNVKGSLCHFFAYIFNEEHITDLAAIRMPHVTRFIAAERARGVQRLASVGHLSTFFGVQRDEGRIEVSPVVPRIHSQGSAPVAPRPFSEQEMAKIWQVLEASGNTLLCLAFAIGEESGLRGGEICNIRLSDITDEERGGQNIFVRLPTKNDRTRTVPFHDKVAKYLAAWKKERNPACPIDHLLHHSQLGAFDTGLLDGWFKKLFAPHPDLAKIFALHRARHTWATRLMNNGMELAVLKELGGWSKWDSMQRYIRVLSSTIQRQYQESYAKLQQQLNEPDRRLSLLDFARLTTAKSATASESTA